ncbi:MAG: phosphopantetheine-binding protein [Puniceicoccales bacterium]|jgi:acyl carrier protein|nr:phosphopantetheine-binding protein [Puniceicoccales bacterium]
MDTLVKEIKQLIVGTLNLEGLTPEDIETDAPLFREGLGLDSIDALELGLVLKNKYKISFSSEDQETRKHFYSVATLAKFIASQRNPDAFQQ